MKNLFLSILAGSLALVGLDCQAQYTGGNADGYTSATLIASACPLVVNSNIYFGGTSAASSSSTLQASACALVLGTNIFFGGNSDGSASASLTATACPLVLNTNIFFGGNNDGHASAQLAVTSCPAPLNTNIFFGGDADGSSNNQLLSSVCPVPINSNIFFGGEADGHASNLLQQAVCAAPLNTNIFLGGSAEGFSMQQLLNTPSPCYPLSIQWLSFTGNCRNQQRVLQWTTATEDNSRDFIVEYSPSGTSWEYAGTIAAAGHSSSSRDYSFTDPVNHAGTTFYRVREVDNEGRSLYSKVISVEDCGWNQPDELSVLPNPSAGIFHLGFTGDKSRVSSVSVFTVRGERIWFGNGYQEKIDLSAQAAGVYFIHFNIGSTTLMRKLLVIR